MEQTNQPSLWRRANDCPILHPEASKDCILPDSYPDIHRILQTGATLTPGRTTWSGGKVQTEGRVRVNVLFADEEGNLHGVRYVLDYQGQMPCPNPDAECSAVAETILEGITTRAQNPRKLAIRARIRVTPTLFCRCTDEPTLSPELSGIALEKKPTTVSGWQISRLSEQGMEASEDLRTEQEPPISRVLWSDLALEVTSCKAAEGEIQLGGVGTLQLFYLTPEQKAHYATVNFPIRSSLPGDFEPDSLCRIYLIPEEVSILPVEDATGEARGLELDFTYSAEGIVATRMLCTRPVDCYQLGGGVQTVPETVTVISDLSEWTGEFAVTVSGEAGEMTAVIKTASVLRMDTYRKDEAAELACVAEITVIGRDAEGKPLSILLTENFALPMDGAQGEPCYLRFSVRPDCTLADGALSVYLSGRMDGLLMRADPVTYVGAVQPCEDTLPSAGDLLTLCYPAPGETLWDIAKRYRIPQSAILAANNIPEDALPTVLLIPH